MLTEAERDWVKLMRGASYALPMYLSNEDFRLVLDLIEKLDQRADDKIEALEAEIQYEINNAYG